MSLKRKQWVPWGQREPADSQWAVNRAKRIGIVDDQRPGRGGPVRILSDEEKRALEAQLTPPKRYPYLSRYGMTHGRKRAPSSRS